RGEVAVGRPRRDSGRMLLSLIQARHRDGIHFNRMGRRERDVRAREQQEAERGGQAEPEGAVRRGKRGRTHLLSPWVELLDGVSFEADDAPARRGLLWREAESEGEGDDRPDSRPFAPMLPGVPPKTPVGFGRTRCTLSSPLFWSFGGPNPCRSRSRSSGINFPRVLVGKMFC